MYDNDVIMNIGEFYFYFFSFLFSIFSRAAVSAVTLPCRPAHLLYLHFVIALSNFEQIKMYVDVCMCVCVCVSAAVPMISTWVASG